jgi:prevent-host-death family protein
VFPFTTNPMYNATMTTDTVSSRELVRHFAETLDRVRYSGEAIVITRNNRPIAVLRPVTKESNTDDNHQ